MQKLAKKISVLMAAVMTLSLMLGFIVASPVKGATLYPQVQYAQEPQMEYTVGDRVSFNLYTPNYGGRVQYRVVLWNDETKSYKDLWNTPDRYYDKWMPYGNNIFTLGWIINEPGHYRITIYAKRAGITNNECYLKGFNCDSYMESDSFVVKAKEVVTQKPQDVAATSMALTTKSVQMVVGSEITVSAKTTPNANVIFFVDAPADSLNKDLTNEVVAGSDGIATFKYTRYYGDADYVTAYSKVTPTVRDDMKVYWGKTQVLTITAMDKDDATTLINGATKQYKVKLVNPMTGEPMRYKDILVMLAENVNATSADLASSAVVTNDLLSYQRVTPFQKAKNIVTGGLNQVTLALRTNDNGEATFTVTGYNTKATPVVFYDAERFFDGNTATVPDSSQYTPTFIGNNDKRLDPTELQATVKQIAFTLIGYKIEYTMDGATLVAVDPTWATGRKFTLTVTKPNGTPYAKGLVNVRMNELFDNNLNNNCAARIIKAGSTTGLKAEQVQIQLDNDGKATFVVGSNRFNDYGTPFVWIDQDTPINGVRNERFEDGEPSKTLDTLQFVNRAVNSGSLAASIADTNLKVTKNEDGTIRNLAGFDTKYTFTIKNQNGVAYIPANTYVLMTYTLKNEGPDPVIIKNPKPRETYIGVFGDYNLLNGERMGATYTLANEETITISFPVTDPVNTLLACSEGDAKLVVNAHAVTSRSSDFSKLEPSNTTDAVVSVGETSSTWVAWDTYEGYTKRDVIVNGQIVAFHKGYDFFVVNPDNDKESFVLIDYNPANVVKEVEETQMTTRTGWESTYQVSYPSTPSVWHKVDLDRFEYQLSLDDFGYYFADTVAHKHVYKLNNADYSNTGVPEFTTTDLTSEAALSDADWTFDEDFNYATTEDTATILYSLYDQYDDLYGADNTIRVKVLVNGKALADRIVIDKDSDNGTMDVELEAGINEITAFIVKNGEAVEDTEHTIYILKAEAKEDGRVEGEIVGFDEEGRIIVLDGDVYYFINVTAEEYQKIIIDNENTTSVNKLLNHLELGHEVVVRFNTATSPSIEL